MGFRGFPARNRTVGARNRTVVARNRTVVGPPRAESNRGRAERIVVAWNRTVVARNRTVVARPGRRGPPASSFRAVLLTPQTSFRPHSTSRCGVKACGQTRHFSCVCVRSCLCVCGGFGRVAFDALVADACQTAQRLNLLQSACLGTVTGFCFLACRGWVRTASNEHTSRGDGQALSLAAGHL